MISDDIKRWVYRVLELTWRAWAVIYSGNAFRAMSLPNDHDFRWMMYVCAGVAALCWMAADGLSRSRQRLASAVPE